MTEAVQVALITATASVAVAVLTLLGVALPVLVKMRRQIGEVKEQVANDHRKEDGSPLNLRDDIDGKHDFNAGILIKLQRDVAWIMRQIVTLRTEFDELEETTQRKDQSDD